MRRAIVLGLAIVFACAGCGGGDEVGGNGETAEPTSSGAADAEPSASDLPDPCGLVSQADVDDVFDGNSPPPEPSEVTGPNDTVGGRSCGWSRGFDTLNVSIFIGANFLTPMRICDYCEMLDGFGDEAWAGVSDQGSGGALLAISVDGRGVQIRADGLDATVEQLLPLAEPVLAGLE
jgi:hypothetical protein